MSKILRLTLSRRFSTHIFQKQTNKKTQQKQKSFSIIFKELPVIINCLRPKSGPLIYVDVRKSIILWVLLKK